MSKKIRKIERPKPKISEQMKVQAIQSSTIVYKCEICNLESNSLFQLREHLRGKKHKMNICENVTSANGNLELGIYEDVNYNLKIVFVVFLTLGFTLIRFLYTFFVLIDAERNHHLFYL